MALNFSTRKKPLSTFSQAGLTDIVLLLLIFFLLTSSFIPQYGIQVNLPQAEAGAPADENFVSVAITADGHFFVDQDEIPVDSLEAAMTAARGAKTALVLRADENATVGQFARVANIARNLDLRILLATEPEE